MGRGQNKLTAVAVKALARHGRHSDGGGLYLFITPGSRRWIFRFTRSGLTREMGLGGYPTVSLAEARGRAQKARAHLTAGDDPIEAREAAKKAEHGRKTFGQCATELFAAKASEWRNAKHRAQWRMTLETFARPLWNLPVDEVATEAVLAVLQPCWQTTPETASRLRGRIEAVIDAARARGLIPPNQANPARWKGHLDKLLSRRQRITRGHHAAMHYRDVPAFLARLREREAIAAMALEFLILTAARTGEVLGARWSEIDFADNIWTIPAARMKAAREHRVPLSGRAVAILERLSEVRMGASIFPGQRPSQGLSGTAMGLVLRRMKIEGVTVHGFRSAFRDWCGEETNFPREIAEAALAHRAGDVTEQAYRRGDALEKRRGLMEAWAAFCEARAGSNVVLLSAAI